VIRPRPPTWTPRGKLASSIHFSVLVSRRTLASLLWNRRKGHSHNKGHEYCSPQKYLWGLVCAAVMLADIWWLARKLRGEAHSKRLGLEENFSRHSF